MNRLQKELDALTTFALALALTGATGILFLLKPKGYLAAPALVSLVTTGAAIFRLKEAKTGRLVENKFEGTAHVKPEEYMGNICPLPNRTFYKYGIDGIKTPYKNDLVYKVPAGAQAWIEASGRVRSSFVSRLFWWKTGYKPRTFFKDSRDWNRLFDA